MKRENKLLVVHKAVISKADLSKQWEVLEHCTSCSVLYLNVLVPARRGSEGQRQPTTSRFEIRDNGDGRRYEKMTHQEAMKNHQGGEIEKENFEHEEKCIQ